MSLRTINYSPDVDPIVYKHLLEKQVRRVYNQFMIDRADKPLFEYLSKLDRNELQIVKSYVWHKDLFTDDFFKWIVSMVKPETK